VSRVIRILSYGSCMVLVAAALVGVGLCLDFALEYLTGGVRSRGKYYIHYIVYASPPLVVGLAMLAVAMTTEAGLRSRRWLVPSGIVCILPALGGAAFVAVSWVMRR
jgi:hypothetical protein